VLLRAVRKTCHAVHRMFHGRLLRRGAALSAQKSQYRTVVPVVPAASGSAA
jgi:hypothetical protein